MQEVKRPATATTSKASAPVKTNVVKERPLSSGASDKKATQSAQPVHRQITSGGNGFVDAVGAGDGFVAGFLYGMSRKKPLPVCAQYGSTLASFVIECDGSTTNLPDEEALLARNQTRPDAM